MRDSVVESGCNGLQFGSETAGDFRRVRFANIQVLRSGKAGIGIQSNDGGTIEDVVFEDITIRRAANPIFINTTRRLRTPETGRPRAGAQPGDPQRHRDGRGAEPPAPSRPTPPPSAACPSARTRTSCWRT